MVAAAVVDQLRKIGNNSSKGKGLRRMAQPLSLRHSAADRQKIWRQAGIADGGGKLS